MESCWGIVQCKRGYNWNMAWLSGGQLAFISLHIVNRNLYRRTVMMLLGILDENRHHKSYHQVWSIQRAELKNKCSLTNHHHTLLQFCFWGSTTGSLIPLYCLLFVGQCQLLYCYKNKSRNLSCCSYLPEDEVLVTVMSSLMGLADPEEKVGDLTTALLGRSVK